MRGDWVRAVGEEVVPECPPPFHVPHVEDRGPLWEQGVAQIMSIPGLTPERWQSGLCYMGRRLPLLWGVSPTSRHWPGGSPSRSQSPSAPSSIRLRHSRQSPHSPNPALRHGQTKDYLWKAINMKDREPNRKKSNLERERNFFERRKKIDISPKGKRGCCSMQRTGKQNTKDLSEMRMILNLF